MDPISVLVVDDSAMMRNHIRRILESDPCIKVVGTAMNGQFALRKTETLNPEVIVLDLEMPELDGIGYLKMRQKQGWDVPVVILSAVAKKGATITMEALSLGASDFIIKSTVNSPEAHEKIAENLIEMVKGYGRTFRRSKRKSEGPQGTALRQEAATPLSPFPEIVAPTGMAEIHDDWPKITPKRGASPPEIIAIGISTGGPNALRVVFAELSPNMTTPVVVVQHMPPGFTTVFAKSLDKICPLEVKEAVDGDILKPGRILIAPGDKHIKIEKKPLAAIVRVVEGELINGHKPSVGVLFNSVAQQYSNAALAIIMTGMGRDGAREIGSVYFQGGTTLAQDHESSVVFGMPRIAIEHNYITQVVPLDEIATAINELSGALG